MKDGEQNCTNQSENQEKSREFERKTEKPDNSNKEHEQKKTTKVQLNK